MTKMSDTIHSFLMVLGILVLAILLFGGPLMLLWNWIMPDIFGLPYIGFWQACGLQLIATLLFKPIIKTSKD
jgi:hypothetical protein